MKNRLLFKKYSIRANVESMKTLVTGGAGFIGSHLVDRLIKDGFHVTVIDNLSTGRKEYINPNAAFYKEDITDDRAIYRIFKKEKPVYVFHLAAIPRVPLSVEDPVGTSRVNIMGTLNVLKAALDTKVKRVVFASSSAVYGDQKKLPLKEDMIPQPISPYALQKSVGEQCGRLFFVLYGLPVVSLRYFNVYGPRIDFRSDYGLVIGRFLRLHREGKPLTIFGDGRQTRAFCYVDDVVEASVRAMKSKKLKGDEVINVGGMESHSVRAIAKLMGGEFTYLPPRQGDVRHTKASTSLAHRLLGWKQKMSFEEGIEKTKQWFEQTPIL